MEEAQNLLEVVEFHQAIMVAQGTGSGCWVGKILVVDVSTVVPAVVGEGGDRKEGNEGRTVEIGNVGVGDASFWDAHGHPPRLVIDGEDRWYGDSWASAAD